jgi:hypothetical protein
MHPEESSTAMRAAPNLVLLPSVGLADASDGQVPALSSRFWGSGLSNEPCWLRVAPAMARYSF